jgi:membrane protease YdiL (CAAX protease family)
MVALLALVAALVAAQIVAAIGLVIWYFSQGGTSARIGAELLDVAVKPPAFILMALAGQLAIGAVAITAAILSPVPFAKRLGLVRPRWSATQCAIAIVGSIVPFAIGMAGAYALAEVIDPDPSIKKMYEAMTPAWALPFILFIALAPGFFEEIMFRGYVQQRLVKRWPAAAAILFTSFVFAIVHVAPHAIVFAFAVGIWLGMLAWQTGSTWPGIVCHAAINGLWNVWQLGVRFELFSEDPPLVLPIALGVIGVGAFAASLWLMFGRGQAADSTSAA